jgi:hypothetical protein
MCFFQNDTGPLRWLGIFVHSAGDRVIFFPGFDNQMQGVRVANGKGGTSDAAFTFDHITLERDFRSWYITSPGSGDHLLGPRTLNLGESRVFWFGMSMADADMLRVVREETRATSPVPSTDGKRRAEVLMAARDNAVFHIVSLNSDCPAPFSETFLHFAFVVGPRGFSQYDGAVLGDPFDTPFCIRSSTEPINRLPVRSHRIELSDAIHIQVICCLLPGQLAVPISLTTPQSAPGNANP